MLCAGCNDTSALNDLRPDKDTNIEVSGGHSQHGFQPVALGINPPVLTSRDQLDAHLGELVAIRGIVSNAKQATILGVDVLPGDLRGEEAYAVGLLTKWTISQVQLDSQFKEHGPFQTNGPGTSYVLYFDLSGKLAEACKWPK